MNNGTVNGQEYGKQTCWRCTNGQKDGHRSASGRIMNRSFVFSFFTFNSLSTDLGDLLNVLVRWKNYQITRLKDSPLREENSFHAFSGDGSRILYLWSGPQIPPAVHSADITGNEPWSPECRIRSCCGFFFCGIWLPAYCAIITLALFPLCASVTFGIFKKVNKIGRIVNCK